MTGAHDHGVRRQGGHQHAGAGAGRPGYRGRLAVALALGVFVLLVEIVGAAVTGSLALFADAGHVLTDVVGVGLALAAVSYATRPPSSRRTFGTLRAEVLAAAFNALLLLGVAGYVLVESVRRWDEPDAISGTALALFAGIGLLANAIGLLVLRKGAGDSLNVRGAYLEVLGDLLGSVAALSAGIVIAVTGWELADVVASLVIAGLMVPRTVLLLRDSLHVLMEGTPRGIDLAEVRRHLREVPGVLDVHDLHAWTITSGVPVLSAHVVVADEVLHSGGAGPLLDRLCGCVGDHFDVAHSTFQLEPAEHAGHEDPTHE
ncbi:MAG: cation transporter [Actinomycetota bacterium]|nr:MAG: cation transporter [Actinomycetota bacterium]